MSSLPPPPSHPEDKPGWAPPPGGAMPGWEAPNRYTDPGTSPYGTSWGQPVHDPKRRYKRGALVWSALGGAVVAFIATVVLIVVIAVTVGDSNSVSATHPRVREGDRSARVGSCLTGSPPDAVVVDQSQDVSCASRHGSEVVGIVRLPEVERYPSSSDLGAFADAACAIAFRSYVGEPVDDSDIDLGSIPPSRAAYDDGDRQVWCVVNSDTFEDGRGSVRDRN